MAICPSLGADVDKHVIFDVQRRRNTIMVQRIATSLICSNTIEAGAPTPPRSLAAARSVFHICILPWQYAQVWGPLSIFPWQHGQSAGRPLLSAVNLTSGQPDGFPRQSDRRPGQPRRSQGNQTGPGQADRILSGSRSVLFRFCFLAFSASSRAVRPAVRNGFLARRPLGLPRTGHWNSLRFALRFTLRFTSDSPPIPLRSPPIHLRSPPFTLRFTPAHLRSSPIHPRSPPTPHYITVRPAGPPPTGPARPTLGKNSFQRAGALRALEATDAPAPARGSRVETQPRN